MINNHGFVTGTMLLLMPLLGAEDIGANVTPPVVRVVSKVDTIHGDIRVDDYYWLRDRQNPEAIEYLKAENDYTNAMMEHTRVLQDELYKEMLARIKETDLSVPVKIDEYFYYSRTEEGKQYSVRCRKKDSLEGPEQVLIDLNELAIPYSYMELGAYEVSPDHRFLAYSIDTAGSERYTLYIKDLDQDRLLAERIEGVGYHVAWPDDNQNFFYTVLDEAKRPYKVYRHSLGTDASEDVMVYHEKDDAFWMNISRTRSEQYLIMAMGSHTTTEILYLDANDPFGDFRVIQPREEGVEYYVEHHGDRFYILTNKDAENFKLMEASVSEPAAVNWLDLIPHRESVMITGFDVFENHLVIYEREDGLEKIRIINMEDSSDYYVEFPEPTYTIWSADNPEFNTNILRFEYMSLVTPRTVFDYHMSTRVRELKKQYEVLGGYDPTQYCSERIWARAEDGTKIPISLVYKEGLKKDGNNPLLLMGYGAYGWSYEPYFSSNRLSLLDRGFIYAIAHVRGGGEMGKHWHRQGQFLNKINTFTDFIACAEHLIKESYTKSELLTISGGSAGGTLMGVVVNVRPDLFKAVVADVPFVDVLNTLLDPTIPLTVVEYTELGSPFEEKFYRYMKSYSPYDNVVRQDYPNILVNVGLNDPRVGYWEPAKWVAKLRALKTDDNLLLLRVKMSAGHDGSSGRYDYLREVAFDYAFILDVLGIGDAEVTKD